MITFLIIFTSLFFSAFFSGIEIAFISSNKVFLEIEKKQNNVFAKALNYITNHSSHFIAALLLGNNIALVIYGIYSGEMIVSWLNNLGYSFSEFNFILLKIFISTVIIIMTSEFLPKVFFQIYAEPLIKYLSPFALFLYFVLYIPNQIIVFITNNIIKLFNRNNANIENEAFGKLELGEFISKQVELAHDKANLDTEIELFQNALEFSSTKARDIMTPRTELCAVDIHDGFDELTNKFIESDYSKILVYHNTLDDIVGYVHHLDLFTKKRTIKSVLKKVEYVPETMLINDLLNLLTKKRLSLAVIIDEYGGTSGIITIEDIIEELFGEIQDEHDDNEEKLIEEQIDTNRYLFSARHEVDYINDTYDLDIEESDSYSTLGGFIVNHHNNIPEIDEVIAINDFEFIIKEASNNKIDVVEMVIKK